MITIKGCTSDVIADISEFIGSLSIDNVSVKRVNDELLYDITLSKKTVLFYHPGEIIIQKSIEEIARIVLTDFRFQEVVII